MRCRSLFVVFLTNRVGIRLADPLKMLPVVAELDKRTPHPNRVINWAQHPREFAAEVFTHLAHVGCYGGNSHRDGFQKSSLHIVREAC